MKKENKKHILQLKIFWKIWKWVEIKCDNLMEGGRKKEMEMLEELKNKLRVTPAISQFNIPGLE